MFRPIKTKRVYEQIVDQIRQLIRRGDLKPGDKLMSERELSELLGVSRTSVREALSALDFLGILESRQGEGTFIANVSEQSLIEPLALIMAMDREAGLELLEVRKMLEGEAAELAALRASEEDLHQMKDALKTMTLDLKHDNLGEAGDAKFHYAIAEATGNKVLVKLMNTISDLLVQNMRSSRMYMYTQQGNAEKLYQQHIEIFEAIQSGDPQDARGAMICHLEFVQEEMTKNYLSEEP